MSDQATIEAKSARKQLSEADAVTITLSGFELFAFMGRAAGKPLSLEGARHYKAAADKIAQQVAEQGYLGGRS